MTQDDREDISLRHHRRTYPRHLIWRREELARAKLAATRLHHMVIRWNDDGFDQTPRGKWLAGISLRIAWHRKMHPRHKATA